MMLSVLQAEIVENDWEGCESDILFTLSTNFLLYFALILIVYLVIKLYVEKKLDNVLFSDVYATNRTPSFRIDPHSRVASRDDCIKYVPVPSSKAMVDFNAEVREESSQIGKYYKLGMFGLGLNICFVIWSILQERILKMEYGHKEFFTFTYGLVFLNRCFGLLVSSLLMHFAKLKWEKVNVHEHALISLLNILSSWCQYESLKFVTMPTLMLSKALKLAPTMIVGKILGNKSYSLYDYVVAGMIGLGVMIFISSSEGFQLGHDSFGRESHLGCGIMLLSLALMFDSFTSPMQSRVFIKHKDLAPIQMMVIMNAFSTIFSMITLVHAGELNNFIGFVYSHPEIHFHIFAFSLCATLGQLLIYHTISYFGAVAFVIIMNSRIALSILASCIIYHHPLKELGVLGLLVVFGAIGYHVGRKLQGKNPLLLSTSQSKKKNQPSLFHGWHQHLDL